ncbi:hypothetical protein A4S06_01235 [Erysipelotrichaceae bacterium MTC7]|nr:hypothetical protein A4S06_01235 [Erysipelotrichaceae bacterium MTC7]
MKPVDIVVLVLAVGFVVFICYRQLKKRQARKASGIIGCNGSCIGCSDKVTCETIRNIKEIIKEDEANK